MVATGNITHTTPVPIIPSTYSTAPIPNKTQSARDKCTMKQLLHECDGNIIVGLNDVVFFGSDTGCCELQTHPADPPSTATTTTDANTKKKAEATENPFEVQAVAVSKSSKADSNQSTEVVWCAVALYDKSLLLFEVQTSIASSSHQDPIVVVSHKTAHKTVKRVSSLCFASVHGPTDGAAAVENSDNSISVIIAGDLAGDVTAYSLVVHEEPSTVCQAPEQQQTSVVGAKDEETMAMTARSTRSRRLLLGHTASMLTSVHVVAGRSEKSYNNNTKSIDDATSARVPHQQYILSSDRDEKIRVSSFPSTHCIVGYLLGHQSFVSSVAVASRALNRCVSLGGDNTLRLWDFTTCQELAVATINLTGSNEEPSEQSVPNSNAQTNGSLLTMDTTTPIPSKVAMSADGRNIAVICDDSHFMNVWTVSSSSTSQDADKVQEEETISSSFSIEHVIRVKCEAQPLGLSFYKDSKILLLLGAPQFLQAVTLALDNGAVCAATTDPHDLFCAPVRQAAVKRNILMPQGLLERDENGSLKMQKMNESRSGATLKPWNNYERKETDKERVRRLRKRRKDEIEAESDE